jgi:glycolate oxidase FAD binding subunit
VAAPAGVVSHQPEEMIVRVLAGTTVSDLQETLASGGQMVPLDPIHPVQATVGGVLAVGHSGPRRLRYGPVRDTVLEVHFVTSAGELVKAGGPVVKNVTGFDLCRLLVGSLGTLALLGEVVLRCQPRPELEAWWMGDGADPFATAAALYRPLAVLWDGARTWVGLAGYAAEVEGQAATVLGSRFEPATGPPPPPGDIRRSRPPGGLRSLPQEAGRGDGWLAEVGVGLVRCRPDVADRLGPAVPQPDGIRRLHRSLKDGFDPVGRLNPGRSALAGADL